MAAGETLLKDMTGAVIGKVTVVCRSGSNSGGQAMWLCRCECGKEFRANGSDLRTGHYVSCGCQKRVRKQTHGLSGTFEHRCWKCMIARCTRPSYKHYSYYGGRGIKVVEEWCGPEGFARFLDHIGKAPSELHSIDRIDNDGNYEPGNVRWATRREQVMNTRRMKAYLASHA